MEIVQTMNSDPGLAVGEAERGEGGTMGDYGHDHGGLGHRAGPVNLILGRIGLKDRRLGQMAGSRSGHRWVLGHGGTGAGWLGSVKGWVGPLGHGCGRCDP